MVACFSLLSGLIFGLLVAFYMLYIVPFLFNTFSLMYKNNNNKKKRGVRFGKRDLLACFGQFERLGIELPLGKRSKIWQARPL